MITLLQMVTIQQWYPNLSFNYDVIEVLWSKKVLRIVFFLKCVYALFFVFWGLTTKSPSKQYSHIFAGQQKLCNLEGFFFNRQKCGHPITVTSHKSVTWQPKTHKPSKKTHTEKSENNSSRNHVLQNRTTQVVIELSFLC